MEMYIYRAFNKETELSDLGIVVAETKDEATDIVLKKFDQDKYTICIIDKEAVINIFVPEIIGTNCFDISGLCSKYGGYKTKNEVMLEKRLNAIQPLINRLSYFKEEEN